ncbi:Type IV / VI secretion system, DotU domain protein [Candidatus Magnetomorum sp. HK-1]|nr:Type IV / VI secretion system, DotU domain protein [Candidatus Magnetomorum sp. HK-1]
MTKPMINKIRPVLDYLIFLRIKLDGDQCNLEVEKLRNEMIMLLKRTELDLCNIVRLHEKAKYKDVYNGKGGRLLSKKIDVVMYTLAALFDDVIARSRWAKTEGDNKWLTEIQEDSEDIAEMQEDSEDIADMQEDSEDVADSSLEFKLFRRSLMGTNFHDISESEGPQDSEMAELFYIALSLGFYGIQDQNPHLKDKLYGWIADSLPDDARFLSPWAKPIKGKSNRLPYLLGFWLFFAVLVVSILTYWNENERLWNDAANIIHETSNQLIQGGY